MEVKNIYNNFKDVDKGTNIKLVKLAGDEDISVFGADIAANSKLTPHYHKNSIEN